MQSTHCVSSVSEVLATTPLPTGHVLLSEQVSVTVVDVLACALNCPGAQAVHSTSSDSVAGLDVNLPASQTSDVGWQGLVSLAAEKFAPGTHASQVVSLTAEGGLVWPSPTPHPCVHGAQVSVAVVVRLI